MNTSSIPNQGIYRKCPKSPNISTVPVTDQNWTTGTHKSPGEKFVKDIKRATRKHNSPEKKTQIVRGGLRGEDSIALPDLVDVHRQAGLRGIHFIHCRRE